MEDDKMNIRCFNNGFNIYKLDLSDSNSFYDFLNGSEQPSNIGMNDGIRRRASGSARRFSQLMAQISNTSQASSLINKQNEEFEKSLIADMEKVIFSIIFRKKKRMRKMKL